MPPDEDPDLSPALEAARRRAGDLDRSGDWPAADLAALASAGATRWAVPQEFGGDGLPPLDLYLRYEQVAAASLALALILSQRDSAVAMIHSAAGLEGRPRLLESLRDHHTFTTVGIAQLTTSRQGGPPALRASRAPGGWRIDGLIPWSTGAAQSAFIVAGAALDDASDASQLLFLLPNRPVSSATLASAPAPTPISAPTPGRPCPDPSSCPDALTNPFAPTEGVTADPPLPLVALRASWTGQVRCDNAFVPDALVLHGPESGVLGRRRPALPLGQAFLAMGLCRGALDLIAAHRSAPAAKALGRLDGQLAEVRREILALSSPGREAAAAAAAAGLRGEVNDLAVRVTHAAVALYKGTALLDTHPAQRLAREAMFLLVWSCPDPVIDCTVDFLSEERPGAKSRAMAFDEPRA